MRNSILSISLALLATAPLTAQISGSINSKYPTSSQTVETTDGAKVMVKYAAINFGQGKFLEMANSEGGRERINSGAESKPIGSMETSKGLNIAGKNVAAGKYVLAFKIDSDSKWNLALKSGDTEHMFPLAMADAAEKQARLSITLMPNGAGDACSVNINFGTKSCSLKGAAAKDSDG